MTADPNVLTGLVKILAPLSSEHRHLAVEAVMTFLGERRGATAERGAGGAINEDEPKSSAPNSNARSKQNGLSLEQIERVFHFGGDGSVEILEIPGKGRREKTLNAYVLLGLGRYLATGDRQFSDDDARAVCETAGCYDPANHSATMKEKGTDLAGDKSKGWTITSVGLKRAATLVKEAGNG
jgi:hypothetical protein